jgi:MYXO-CTERM domain-containing protein
MKRSLEVAGFGLLAAGTVAARRYRRDLDLREGGLQN